MITIAPPQLLKTHSFDTPEDFCRLQDDVEDALLTGVDVCVMSFHEPETFENINKYLIDNEDGDQEV